MIRALITLFLFFVSTSVYSMSESALDDYIFKASNETGVSPHLIKAIIKQETHFIDKYVDGSVKSSAGAIGAMQLMPATAAGLEPKGYYTEEKLRDPQHNIMAGALYLRELMSLPQLKGANGNADLLLVMAAYNSGPNNDYTKNGQIPVYEETVNYVTNAAKYYTEYAGIPPLDTSSIPTAPVGTIPGGGKGTLPYSASIPVAYANSSEILSKFETYSGASATTMTKILTGILGGLLLFFAALQVLMFWVEAITKGSNDLDDLSKAALNTLRTFVVVVILFNFITT